MKEESFDFPPLTSCSSSAPVCKTARADLVFLVDGSWSISDDNFLKIIRFLSSTTGALDQIGPEGTQVPESGDLGGLGRTFADRLESVTGSWCVWTGGDRPVQRRPPNRDQAELLQ